MTPHDDENFEVLLREHMKSELDPQLGRAPAAFARSSRRLPWRAASHWRIFAPLAVAAAIAVVLLAKPVLTLLESRQPAPPAYVRNNLRSPDSLNTTPAEYQVAWNTTDQGTVFVDGEVPMRSIRRQRLDSIQWTDPETNAQMEMTVPHDEIVLVGLHAN